MEIFNRTGKSVLYIEYLYLNTQCTTIIRTESIVLRRPEVSCSNIHHAMVAP